MAFYRTGQKSPCVTACSEEQGRDTFNAQNALLFRALNPRRKRPIPSCSASSPAVPSSPGRCWCLQGQQQRRGGLALALAQAF